MNIYALIRRFAKGAGKTGRILLEAARCVARGRRNLVGIAICMLIFCWGFMIHGNVGLYFNLAGFLIVVGGTFSAALISFQTDRLLVVYKVLKTSYRTQVKEPEEIIELLVDLSVKSRLKGLLSLEEDEGATSIGFLRSSLGLLVDGFSGDQIEEILGTEMYFFRLRREESERVLRTMAEIAPAFGLVGSVVGLISLLAGVGQTATIMATIPIALTSTLYGVVLANFAFSPFAAHLRERTDRELLLQRIITDAVLAIESEVNPRILERKLKSFLTPSLRKGRLVSLERIREKFDTQSQTFEPLSTKHPSAQHL